MTQPAPDRPYRGRRLTWGEFYRIRPDLRPANDNVAKAEAQKKPAAKRASSPPSA